MSDKPTNGAGVEDEVAEDDDEDEIPVEVEDADTRPVKVPDLGAALSHGAAEPIEAQDADAQLSHEDMLELVGQGEQEKAALAEQIKQLEEKLEASDKEKKDHYERLLRSTADMENLRKRTRKDIDDSKLDVRGKALKEILPVIDNLERALTHAEQTSDDAQGIIEGVKLVMRQFEQALERLDVKSVDAKGQPFDPNVHEAVTQAPSADVAPGSVLEVLQRGYTIGARLLRPSLVVVAQAPPEDTEPEPEPEIEPEPEAKIEPIPMPPADDDAQAEPESEPEPERET